MAVELEASAARRRDPDFTAAVARFSERLLIDGARIDGRVQGRLLGARLVRSMEGASSVELRLWDGDLKLLRSGLLRRRGNPGPRKKILEGAAWAEFGEARLTLDGAFFRLAGVAGNYSAGRSEITVTFEDEIASLLRRHKKPLKASRGSVTRAGFIRRLVREVVSYDIVFNSPEEDDKQKIKGDNPRERAKEREKGIPRNSRLTIKSQGVTREQLRNIETALAVADEEGAGERPVLAMLVAGIGESDFKTIANLQGSNYHGVFQGSKDVFAIGDTEGMARSFLRGGKGFQAGGAMSLAASESDAGPGEIATRVEASGKPPGFYGQWIDEAEKILEAWGGAGKLVVEREKYEYRRKKGEDSWTCSGRLAEEVRWRRFATENVLHYVSDEFLFTRRKVFTITPDSPGVNGIEFDADVGIPVSEFTAQVRKARWVLAPGYVGEVQECGPLNGNWLTWSIDEDLLLENATLILRRPEPKLPEPEADKTVRQVAPGGIRDRIIAIAERSMTSRTGFSRYSQAGALTAELTPGPGKRSDCSQWVRAVYLKAGVEDPGLNTWAQSANGTRTSKPRKGDLMFPTGGGHVEIYIGGGKTIGHGSPPIDYGNVSFWPGHYFVTFDFLDG